jgi:hypothetical protein
MYRQAGAIGPPPLAGSHIIMPGKPLMPGLHRCVKAVSTGEQHPDESIRS